ncbi:MAG: class I SAM-dependent methyltransferase, partial [Alphaproteobacteria bacterium]
MAKENDDTTHFGYRDIKVEEKAPLVQGVFESVASRYDIMNDLMSMGAHRLWKDALMDWMRPRAGEICLDVAGGTGDIAERIRQRQGGSQAPGRVLVFDLTEGMLQAALMTLAQARPWLGSWRSVKLELRREDSREVFSAQLDLPGGDVVLWMTWTWWPERSDEEAEVRL